MRTIKAVRKPMLAAKVLALLATGSIGIMPMAAAMPQVGTSATATITNTSAVQMDITSNKTNNVINWQGFSVAKGETVQFDGGNNTNNYLNIVTGGMKSDIYGAVRGGNNIYIINPNGILFGATAEVNVGNLVASTRTVSDTAAQAFAVSGTSPLAAAATSAAGDIVNMGNLQAASVVLEGNNICLVNTAQLTSDGTQALSSANGSVTVRAGNAVHIGYSVGAAAAAVNDTEYKTGSGQSASALGYAVTGLDGSTAKTGYDYMLVRNVYELQNIQNKLDGQYMLANDIDASETKTWNYDATSRIYHGFRPMGDVTPGFNGTLDGIGHTINGLQMAWNWDNVGLFGYLGNGAVVSNVGLVGGSVAGNSATGAFAGIASDGSKLINVYNTGEVKGTAMVGGLVGDLYSGSSVTAAYNTGAVTGSMMVGGIVGAANSNCTVADVYNIGAVSGSGNDISGVVGSTASTLVSNAYYATTDDSGRTINARNDSNTGSGATLEAMKKASTYSFAGGLDAAGGQSCAWRIYDGYTLPMLKSFLNSVQVSGAVTVTYNAKEQGVDAATLVYDTNVDSTKVMSHTRKSAGTYQLADMLYSSQNGYDFVSTDAFTILPKTVTAAFDTVTKVYDGKKTVDMSKVAFSLQGIISGDDVTMSVTGASYDSKDAGADKTITYTGLALSSTDYILDTAAQSSTGKGIIQQKTVTPTLTKQLGYDKSYDGTATAVLGTNYQFAADDIVSGDDVTLSAAGRYEKGKAAAGEEAVEFTDLALGGTAASNYCLAAGMTLSGRGTIAKKTITPALVQASGLDKTYDGTAVATLGTNYLFVDGGVQTGDIVTLTGTGSYANGRDVSLTAGQVDFTGLTLNGTDAGNYTLAGNTTLSGQGRITPADLIFAADHVTVRVGTSLPQVFTGTVSGFVAGETASNAFGDKQLSFYLPTAVDTQQAGFYGIVGGIAGISFGGYGNYTFRQAAGNATALEVTGYIPGRHYHDEITQLLRPDNGANGRTDNPDTAFGDRHSFSADGVLEGLRVDRGGVRLPENIMTGWTMATDSYIWQLGNDTATK